MGIEQIITEKYLLEQFSKIAGTQIEISEFKAVYAWKDSFCGRGENYALAFHFDQPNLWMLNLCSESLRKIPIHSIRYIKEEPSCRYQFVYRRSLMRESFYVPYLSEPNQTHFRCVQMESAKLFHLFCNTCTQEPRHLILKRKLMMLLGFEI